MKNTITADRAQQLVSYDPNTGIIRRKERTSNSIQVGDVAGCLHPNGYIYVYIDGSRYKAHRIAWLIYYGKWPSGCIDHINRNRSDNRISNLRDVSVRTNAENISKFRKNTSGLAGVSWMTSANKWRAQICHQKNVIYLGLFSSKEAAHSVYLKAKQSLHEGSTI